MLLCCRHQNAKVQAACTLLSTVVIYRFLALLRSRFALVAGIKIVIPHPLSRILLSAHVL